MHGSVGEAHCVARADPASIVIYTAISGGYDSLKTLPAEATAGAELVAFVDEDPGDAETHWHRRSLEQGFDDPARNAKIHKILAHRYFPETDYSLWLDGNVVFNFRHPVARLVERHLVECDLVVFRHSRR